MHGSSSAQHHITSKVTNKPAADQRCVRQLEALPSNERSRQARGAGGPAPLLQCVGTLGRGSVSGGHRSQRALQSGRRPPPPASQTDIRPYQS
ncbi:unnamed protein product [Arctogadus glacialis]